MIKKRRKAAPRYRLAIANRRLLCSLAASGLRITERRRFQKAPLCRVETQKPYPKFVGNRWSLIRNAHDWIAELQRFTEKGRFGD